MAYISDCLEAITKLLSAESSSLSQRIYNINAISFTPEELALEINRQGDAPFKVKYNPDFRQAIADSWPESMDDSAARRDWQWDPKIDSTEKLVKCMLYKLAKFK